MTSRLSFLIDQYVELTPSNNPFQFHGSCKLNGKNTDILVDEFENIIKIEVESFPPQIFFQSSVELSNFLSNFSKIRHEFNSETTSSKAMEINRKLHEMSKNIHERCKELYMFNHNLIKSNIEVAACIQLVLSHNHHLFHNRGDNVICSYEYSYLPNNVDDIIMSNDDFNDSNALQDFSHCFLFHEFICHQKIHINDLTSVGSYIVDYNISATEIDGFFKND